MQLSSSVLYVHGVLLRISNLGKIFPQQSPLREQEGKTVTYCPFALLSWVLWYLVQVTTTIKICMSEDMDSMWETYSSCHSELLKSCELIFGLNWHTDYRLH